MVNMAKGSHGRISRPAKNNEGCLWGLFRMLNFQQAGNSQRLLANELQYGRIASGDRYSSDALDLPYDFAEKDTGSIFPGQGEAENDTLHKHDRIRTDEISDVQQAENSSSAKNKQILAPLGCDDSSVNIHRRSDSPRIFSRLDCYDLAVPTYNDYSACSIHSLTERFCNGLQLATLLQEIHLEKNKDQGVKCRKNGCFNTSVNARTREAHAPNRSNANLHHDTKFLWDFCDKLFHVEEMTTSPEVLHQSNDLLDRLKVLSSNKELLYQLLQDPHSKLMEHVEKLRNSHGADLSKAVLGKSLEKQSPRNIFMEEKGSGQKTKDSSKQIVVLKPLPSRMGGLSIASKFIASPRSSQRTRAYVESRRASFAFSFQELKRRLRHLIGEKKKERKSRSSGGDIRGGGSLTSYGAQTHFSAITSCRAKSNNDVEIQGKQKPRGQHLDIDLGRDTVKNQETRTICILQSESDFQREAKNHLKEMLHSNSDCEHRQEKHISKALWNILSLQDYNFSPVHSPGRQKESCSSPPEMRISPLWSLPQQGNSETLDLARHNPESPVCSSANADTEPLALDLSSKLVETKLEDEESNIEAANLEGMMQIVDSNNSYSTETCENTSTINEISDDNNYRMTRLDETETDDKTQSLRLDSPIERKSSTCSTPSTLLIHDAEVPEIIMEKMDRPSPVSVLTPPFIDDPTSSSSPVSEQRENVGLPISPRELQFNDCNKSEDALITMCSKRDQGTPMREDEFKFEYTGSLLKASGLIHIETWERRQSLCNLLDPSLFDEVEIPFGDIPCDLALLFDCIGEVLEGIREKYIPRKPWAALTKPSVRPFPCQESLIQEVCGKTACYHAMQSLNTLNQVIEKDLDVIIWMDTSAEIDDMGIAVEDEILEETLEELLLDICNQVETCR